MLGHKLPLTVIEFPNGRAGYRGSVPRELCNVREATRNDVLGQRAFRGEDGELYCAHPMSFDSHREAVEYAETRGFTVD